MREILFRAKRKLGGAWNYGDLIHYSDRAIAVSDEEGNFVSVRPETVGQYTGLTDKNGKKIFEGDIVEGWDVIFTVVFDEYCRYVIVAGYGNYLLAQNHEDMEVIGNIHDNPELLKGGAV